MRVVLGELYGLAVRTGNPDARVIITDRHGFARRSPDGPCLVYFGQAVFGLVFPVQNPGLLITDQDLIVGLEAIVIVTGSEEAIVAKQLSTIEQPRLNLWAIRSSEDGRGRQQGGHTN